MRNTACLETAIKAFIRERDELIIYAFESVCTNVLAEYNLNSRDRVGQLKKKKPTFTTLKSKNKKIRNMFLDIHIFWNP